MRFAIIMLEAYTGEPIDLLIAGLDMGEAATYIATRPIAASPAMAVPMQDGETGSDTWQRVTRKVTTWAEEKPYDPTAGASPFKRKAAIRLHDGNWIANFYTFNSLVEFLTSHGYKLDGTIVHDTTRIFSPSIGYIVYDGE